MLIKNLAIASKVCKMIKLLNCIKIITVVFAFFLIVCNTLKMCRN